MSSNAIHLFVHEGRYGIKEKLGISTIQNLIPKVHAESNNINILDDNGMYTFKHKAVFFIGI